MAQSDKQYFIDFFKESDVIDDSFTVVDKKGTTHIFDKRQVLNEILAMPSSIKKKVRHKFVQIDFKRGDINHFITYLLQGLVNQ
jgi:hypothetical protein